MGLFWCFDNIKKKQKPKNTRIKPLKFLLGQGWTTGKWDTFRLSEMSLRCRITLRDALHRTDVYFLWLLHAKIRNFIKVSYGDGKAKDCILGFVSISSNSLFSMISGLEFLAELMHSTLLTLTI